MGDDRVGRGATQVPHPDAVVRELVRVTRPGGALVVLDFDWDTLVIDHPDRELTRQIGRSTSDGIQHGQIGRQLPRLFRGTVDRAKGCSLRRISHATIESDEPMKYHVDGEPVSGGTRLQVRVHPAALYVAV